MTRYTVLDPKNTSLSLMMLGWSTSCVRYVCVCVREREREKEREEGGMREYLNGKRGREEDEEGIEETGG
jgi:hypothetical protein